LDFHGIDTSGQLGSDIGPVHHEQTGPNGQYIRTKLARRSITSGPFGQFVHDTGPSDQFCPHISAKPNMTLDLDSKIDVPKIDNRQFSALTFNKNSVLTGFK